MNMLSNIALYFLGLQFIIFGLNGFFRFLQLPKTSDQIESFIEALEKTRFLMPTVKTLEIVAGALCLSPRFQLLGLFMLAPIVFNIVGIHVVFNRPKAWIIILQVLLPYLIGISSQLEKIKLLLF